MSVYVIAEAGVNHNGSQKQAFELVEAAIASGADAVKFQIFRAQDLVTSTAVKAKYQLENTAASETQHKMLQGLELPYELHCEIAAYCKTKKIDYLASVFDFKSLEYLVQHIDPPFLKIASGEITNGPFLLKHAEKRKKLLLSTGMSTIVEIEQALQIIAFGLIHGPTGDYCPSIKDFEKAFVSDEGQKVLRSFVTLLHCTTQYPTPGDEVNLQAMVTINKEFGLDIGFSDHSVGDLAPTVATALGAKMIEKHLTLDKNMLGPDHSASMEQHEFAKMVDLIRSVEATLGSGVKRPTESELKNRIAVRRSLVCSRGIKKGELFTDENLSCKRPGSGISPMKYWKYLGHKASKDLGDDQLL